MTSGCGSPAANVDLRVFVYYGKQPGVVPAALTRVASAGSTAVNCSRGGGANDTCVFALSRYEFLLGRAARRMLVA